MRVKVGVKIDHPMWKPFIECDDDLEMDEKLHYVDEAITHLKEYRIEILEVED